MFIRFKKDALIIIILGLSIMANAVDLSTDLSEGADIKHVLGEAFIVIIATSLIVWILYERLQQSREIKQLKTQLLLANKSQTEASEYIIKARKQLSEVITHQFDDWSLTSSEKEVGWLLLKGLSAKEIAEVRETLEKTVRQQASSIYKKAGLSGRHTFSAWFIEDLF